MPLKDPIARATYKAKWLKNKVAKRKEYHRETHLQKRYGISAEQYDVLLQAQNGGCAVCGAGHDSHQKYLHVDHDHRSGRVRGLLCGNCNRGIGLMQDKPERLESAARYLRGQS